MSISNLKIYSLGIVVTTKVEGNDDILVTPIEHLSMQETGPLRDNKRTYKNDLGGLDSKPVKSEVKGSDYLKAMWINLGNNNRMTAPDVVEGETVLLFKFGDVDEYYWTTIFREPSIRRLESVYYGFSNLPKGIESFTKDTSYWYNIDTRHKKIQLHTSKNDGEFGTYDITLDTKKGTLTIQDSLKNTIELLSTKGTLNVTTEGTINLKAKSAITVTAPTITMNGNVTINGNLTTTGNSTTNGSVSAKRGLSTSGNMDAKGTVSGSNI